MLLCWTTRGEGGLNKFAMVIPSSGWLQLDISQLVNPSAAPKIYGDSSPGSPSRDAPASSPTTGPAGEPVVSYSTVHGQCIKYFSVPVIDL